MIKAILLTALMCAGCCDPHRNQQPSNTSDQYRDAVNPILVAHSAEDIQSKSWTNSENHVMQFQSWVPVITNRNEVIEVATYRDERTKSVTTLEFYRVLLEVGSSRARDYVLLDYDNAGGYIRVHAVAR